MDIELQGRAYIAQLLEWWHSGGDGPYYAWIVLGVALLLFLAWMWHRLIRKILGHRKFRGTWYNTDQLEVLVKMIDEDNAKGNRVMKHDEMALLRLWRFGSSKTGLSDHVSGYG